MQLTFQMTIFNVSCIPDLFSFLFRARWLIICSADIHGFASLLMSILFPLGGLPAHPQTPRFWRINLFPLVGLI
jgi:phosphotransferase system  glucose/maltose/N-acetylglucosamine-specific IIC component